LREATIMHTKNIVWFGRSVTLACDGKCNKAWGVQTRPKERFDPFEPDDTAMLADDELGEAPADPGTCEGGDIKPENPDGKNKWCSRECERASIIEPGRQIAVHDFSKRIYNQPWKHMAQTTTK